MKLLFICDKIDLALKHRLDQLTQNDIEASALVLPKFTLYKNWEKEVIEPDDGIFDSTSFFSSISKSLKYKKLFNSLDHYDSINIYKCSSLCAPYFDELKKVAKTYYITVEDDINVKGSALSKLFRFANCLLFDNEKKLESFESKFGYDEKTLISRDSSSLMGTIDSLKKIEVDKFRDYLNIDASKNIVYCDLGVDYNLQVEFINNLNKLPVDQIRDTTFIFDAGASTIVDKERLIEFINTQRFDFLLPDSLLTDKQKAMLLVISKSTIILSHLDERDILYPSMYVKNHIYYYGDQLNSTLAKDKNLFVDTFENFENLLSFNSDSHHLVDELLEKNMMTIKKLFHPSVVTANYLEVLKIL